eukprot:1195806-Prorocentrum_minimum.AAC.11
MRRDIVIVERLRHRVCGRIQTCRTCFAPPPKRLTRLLLISYSSLTHILLVSYSSLTFLFSYSSLTRGGCAWCAVPTQITTIFQTATNSDIAGRQITLDAQFGNWLVVNDVVMPASDPALLARKPKDPMALSWV